MTLLSKQSIPMSLICLLAAGLAACVPGPFMPGSNASRAAELARIAALRAHRQGPLAPDSDPLHLAIDGVGYFNVIDPKTGLRLYTRKGEFSTDANGQVQTAEGYLLDPMVALPPGSLSLFVAEDGTVMLRGPGQTEHQSIARLGLTRFPKPQFLTVAAGPAGYYVPNSDSGQGEQGQPTQNGFGLVIGRAREALSAPPQAVPDSGCLKNTGTIAPLESPGNQPLDLLIQGKGFFVLRHPGTGETLFTRKGRFHLKRADEYPEFIKAGALVNEAGYLLQGEATAGNKALSGGGGEEQGLAAYQGAQSVDAGGTITAGGKAIGRIQLAFFSDESLLETFSFARQSMYRIRPERLNADFSTTGLFTRAFPGEGGTGSLKSGAFEPCGADLITLPAGAPGAPPLPSPSPSATPTPAASATSTPAASPAPVASPSASPSAVSAIATPGRS